MKKIRGWVGMVNRAVHTVYTNEILFFRSRNAARIYIYDDIRRATLTVEAPAPKKKMKRPE